MDEDTPQSDPEWALRAADFRRAAYAHFFPEGRPLGSLLPIPEEALAPPVEPSGPPSKPEPKRRPRPKKPAGEKASTPPPADLPSEAPPAEPPLSDGSADAVERAAPDTDLPTAPSTAADAVAAVETNPESPSAAAIDLPSEAETPSTDPPAAPEPSPDPATKEPEKPKRGRGGRKKNTDSAPPAPSVPSAPEGSPDAFLPRESATDGSVVFGESQAETPPDGDSETAVLIDENAPLPAEGGAARPKAERRPAIPPPPPVPEAVRLHLRGVLEALIFASAEPQDPRELARLAKAELKLVKELLVELRDFYHDRGFRLDEVAGGYAFRTSPAFSPFVRELVAKKPVRMSRAQLETLAIVAYKQPITRPEIDDVRGVDSGPVLKSLLERGLVRILGKKEDVGRPMLYGTTGDFLAFFGLKALADLPTLREFTELTDESRRTYEREMGEDPPEAGESFSMGGLAGEGDLEMKATKPKPEDFEDPDPAAPPAEPSSAGESTESPSSSENAKPESEGEDDDEEDEDDDEEDEDDDEEDEDDDEEDEDDEDDEDEDDEDDEDDDDEDEDEEDEDGDDE
ncbi:MAG: SMC-Scp complex subunit ScpB [Polyangiaceae bacterium]|nr:SMC-Scp complex subunit ScpB [Polyangiaceae bacterium]